MSNITVSLPDGSERELPADSTALDLAAAIGSGLKKAAVAAVVDGRETDLTAPLPDGPRCRSSRRAPTRAATCCATRRPT
jgi:threonyl-tRNA synthetase